jgi:hypothetical protein
MHDGSPARTDRYVPFKQEGWGIALLVVLLAAAFIAWATYVHKTTYLHPTDTRFRAAGEHAPATSHD